MKMAAQRQQPLGKTWFCSTLCSRVGFLGTDIRHSVGTPGFECNVYELGSRILVGHFQLEILSSSVNHKPLLA